jgi:2-polyprenyl-3-methyl-5-hydroxy-6-metoxy-1,4-benzoquinol methylase
MVGDSVRAVQSDHFGIAEAAAAWRASLAHDGYEHHVGRASDIRSLRRLPRSLRQVLRITGLRPPSRVLEVGCGGGAQLVPIALKGFDCTGVDCSPPVLLRLKDFAREVSSLSGRRLAIKTVAATFPDVVAGRGGFDLVYEFGVVEHVLSDAERMHFHRSMVACCRPDGWVAHAVPNGSHPLRQRVRNESLGGYDIPEIDYTAHSLANELERSGLRDVAVYPVNVLGYLMLEPDPVRKLVWAAAQLMPRWQRPTLQRHALSLLAIGRR